MSPGSTRRVLQTLEFGDLATDGLSRYVHVPQTRQVHTVPDVRKLMDSSPGFFVGAVVTLWLGIAGGLVALALYMRGETSEPFALLFLFPVILAFGFLPAMLYGGYAGFMLAGTLLVLLVASINYQLNLGYLLTFLLGGAALAAMHVSHANLRGLQLALSAPAPQFCGAATPLTVTSGRAALTCAMALDSLSDATMKPKARDAPRSRKASSICNASLRSSRSSGSPTEILLFRVESIEIKAHLVARFSEVLKFNTRSRMGLPYLDSPIWK